MASSGKEGGGRSCKEMEWEVERHLELLEGLSGPTRRNLGSSGRSGQGDFPQGQCVVIGPRQSGNTLRYTGSIE